MNLKFQNLQIDPTDPFSKDLLNRKPEIENLSTLISNLNSPAVLAIDSPWGTGKTTFIKMWEAFLQNNGIESLYFNAWATDFSEDPLISFLGEMNDGLSKLISSSAESNETWERAKNIGTTLAKKGIPALIKIATAGVIDAEKIIEDEASKVMEALTGDMLNNYFRQKSAIAEFHEALTKLIAESKIKPIVIFVDELDRCRPTYSISLLERIKHLFNIEGLVFVLSLDKYQLCHSISAVYGYNFDSESYLRRFFDFEYQLKRPEIKGYVKALVTVLELDKFLEPRKKYVGFRYDLEHLEMVFLMLVERLNLPPREVEQLIASINLAIRTTKENEYVYPALLVFLVIAKNKRPKVYQHYILPSENERAIIDYLYELIPEQLRYKNFSFECALIEGFLIAAKIDRYERSECETYNTHRKNLADETCTSDARGESWRS
ncbi:P-loop NTPase fold protein [Methylomonas sp. EFPC3]|uniref:KAP family P-loop NTPase fold protein n=1 Tax=Methylomonas sp. EFPC3 TaxID=3021710 RepID=UPI002418137A|nr:P-loop NTPase fold protein [Methylomonas sp. EFPC3]WFP52093.1 P-loop NTPase fold protein [Methylomonas sp. EFPC3]